MSINIAIDGPAGAGKSTIAKMVAKQLGYIYVDTGAMYRAMALYIMKQNIKPEEAEKISDKCKEADISIEYRDGAQIVILNGEDVTGMLRTEEVGNMASVTSVNPDVRAKLVDLQRVLASKQNVVMDGRDIGTVVLPNASVKIYLTASSKVRAERRYLELKAKGEEADINKIEADIIERDNRDMNRDISPLRQAEDAVLIDSSDMTVDEVVKAMIELVERA